MNMESAPNNAGIKKEETEKIASRRNFLKKAAAGLSVGAVGAIIGESIGESYEKKQQLDKVVELYKGKEEDFKYATKAMSLLLHEMEKENLARVYVSGTKHTNKVINFLGEFITKHLKSKVSMAYSPGIKGILKTDGFYTESTLIMLMNEANTTVTIPAYPSYGYTSPTPTSPSTNSSKGNESTKTNDQNQERMKQGGKNVM